MTGSLREESDNVWLSALVLFADTSVFLDEPTSEIHTIVAEISGI